MNIKEDYVSFEIAKLLKEKGFDVPCNCYGAYDGVNLIYRFCLTDKYTNWNKYFSKTIISCPTIQMVKKWFRIEHGIHIEPHIVKTKHSYGYMPNYIDLKELKQHIPFDEFDFNNADKYACITYDKACEATIKYCLENII